MGDSGLGDCVAVREKKNSHLSWLATASECFSSASHSASQSAVPKNWASQSGHFTSQSVSSAAVTSHNKSEELASNGLQMRERAAGCQRSCWPTSNPPCLITAFNEGEKQRTEESETEYQLLLLSFKEHWSTEAGDEAGLFFSFVLDFSWPYLHSCKCKICGN